MSPERWAFAAPWAKLPSGNLDRLAGPLEDGVRACERSMRQSSRGKGGRMRLEDRPYPLLNSFRGLSPASQSCSVPGRLGGGPRWRLGFLPSWGLSSSWGTHVRSSGLVRAGYFHNETQQGLLSGDRRFQRSGRALTPADDHFHH